LPALGYREEGMVQDPISAIISNHRRARLALQGAEEYARSRPNDEAARERLRQASESEAEAFATIIGTVRLLMPEALIQILRYSAIATFREPATGNLGRDRGLLAVLVLALSADDDIAANDDDQPPTNG
jgi:hypothetical protein